MRSQRELTKKGKGEDETVGTALGREQGGGLRSYDPIDASKDAAGQRFALV